MTRSRRGAKARVGVAVGVDQIAVVALAEADGGPPRVLA